LGVFDIDVRSLIIAAITKDIQADLIVKTSLKLSTKQIIATT